jgi:hypothetical protein
LARCLGAHPVHSSKTTREASEIIKRPGRFRASGVLAKKRLDRVLRRQGTFERVAGGRDAEHPRVRRAIE